MTIGQMCYINDVLNCGVMSKGFGDSIVWKYNGAVYVFDFKDLFNRDKEIKPIYHD